MTGENVAARLDGGCDVGLMIYGSRLGNSMTIFIGNVETTDKGAMEFISRPDDFERQIIGAWCRSKIDHRFKNKKKFRKAVRKNQRVLRGPVAIEAIFTSRNYLFSTVTEGREETLYFRERNGNRTGRLRQQHPRGPLAKIDTKLGTHRFLSKRRFEWVNDWHHKHERCLPHFRVPEKRAKDGNHHVEFAREKKRVSRWHSSQGTIKIRKHDLNRLIGSALENILGIRAAAASVGQRVSESLCGNF